MKRKNKHGVKLKIWEYFCIFAILLLVIIWLLQIVFFQYYYIGAMARETINNAREIVSDYKKNKLSEDSVAESAMENNIVIVITDPAGYVINAYDDMGKMDRQRLDDLNNYGKTLGNLHDQISKSERNEVYYRIENKNSDTHAIFYGAYAEKADEQNTGAYFYVLSLLQPINSVVAVIQKQFVIITIIALIMALIIAYVIARRFSRPVEKLTSSARELALGNLDADFECEEAFYEISDLSKALKYASQEISKSVEFRRELLANVSHDLRTPLTMIKMYAEMIRDISGDNKEKREKNLQVIIDETDRLTLLVNDILEFSKIENSNGSDIELKAFDISKTVNTVLERFSIMTEQGYLFELEAPEVTYVIGDEARIVQVIYNLLSNAINYTGDDLKVKIRITRKFDSARIEIIDTGEGIPREELANVWDRYYRAKTHIRSKVGTGLGLSIVKNILKAHNADFGIESTMGVGSNFWFELKLPENSGNKVLRLADNNTVSDDE